VIGVVEFCGDESVKFTIPQHLERADVFVKEFCGDLDAIALKGAEQIPMKRNGRVAELGDEIAGFVIERYQDRNLPVVDELKFLGDGRELEFERKDFIAAIKTEAVEDILRVPAAFLLIVIKIEVVMDGIFAE